MNPDQPTTSPSDKPARQSPITSHWVFLALKNTNFAICAILLLAFTLTFGSAFSGKLQPKLRLDLKKKLDLMNKARLYPYEVFRQIDIPPEMLNALGTQDYIQWFLQDSTKSSAESEDFVQLFVTYYTGNPDQVPHVPEECYLGGGGFTVSKASVERIAIPALGDRFTIPLKVLEFERATAMGTETRVVMYTFFTNGQFCEEREGTRRILSDPGSQHAFYSKLELSVGIPDHPVPREQALEAGTRALRVITPVLIQDHWPDFEKAEQRVAKPAAK